MARRSGYTIIQVATVVVAIVALGGIIYTVGNPRNRAGGNNKAHGTENRMPDRTEAEKQADAQANAQADEKKRQAGSDSNSQDQAVRWQQTGNGWEAMGTPPACPNPVVFQPPADLNLATGILYPGQKRGGNYKPHGGFRFDNQKDNKIQVTAPMDAALVRGSRYLVDGELQYTFDFIAPCGLMYRLGHFLKLTPKFQAIADKFPAASEGDSRTERVEPQVRVSAGEVIATEVGITKPTANTFFDWGVYDLRQKNKISSDPAWAKEHADDHELAPYAVCWFDMLSAEDEAKVRSLPAGDPTSGKKSDYCQ